MDLRLFLNTAIAWERLGIFAWPAFAGVLIVEAQKHVYAPIKGHRAPVRANMQGAHGRLAALRNVQQRVARRKRRVRSQLTGANGSKG
jgi:hypothetical protein